MARAIRGWPQKKLASQAGCDSSHISLMEHGKRLPTLPMLEKISTASGVPLYLLILFASDMKTIRKLSRTPGDRIIGREFLKLIS
jgi:transcriptional regulator with XRE-family HTH domain